MTFSLCVVDRLLLLKGDTLCSTKNASLAMSPLLEAITLAKRSHCRLLASMATVHLAYVQAGQFIQSFFQPSAGM